MHFQPPHLSLLFLWTGLAVSSVHLQVSDYLVIGGAIAFAVASLRGARMRVLRDTNADLSLRNTQLEAEHVKDVAELEKLRAQSSAELAKVVSRLVDRLDHHDEHMRQIAQRQAEQVDKQIHLLTVISAAVMDT